MRHVFLLWIALWIGAAYANAKPIPATDIQAFQSQWRAIEQGSSTWQTPSLTNEWLQAELHIKALRQSEKLPSVQQRASLLKRYRAHHSIQHVRQHWIELAWAIQDSQSILSLAEPEDRSAARCAYAWALGTAGQTNTQPLHRAYVDSLGHPICRSYRTSAEASSWITDWSRAERMKAALKRGNYAEAKRLAEDLGPKNQTRVADWIEARQAPEAYIQRKPNGTHREVALRKLIAADPVASEQWLAPEERALWEWRAVHLILDQAPETGRALKGIKRPAQTRPFKEWEARHLLLNENWDALNTRIQSFPPALRAEPVWQYWRAIALEKTGDTGQSQNLMEQLAQKTGYYGMLAADHIGLEYRLPTPRQKTPGAGKEIASRTSAKIAHALLQAGQNTLARGQWRAFWSSLTQAEKIAAADLTAQWDWANEQIRAAVNTGQFQSLLMYPDTLRPVMSGRVVDADWLLGLTRTESLFQADARSRAGALGLMQVLPKTGQEEAKRQEINWRGAASLIEPDVNIAIGSAYLGQMANRFGGNWAMATAAYNAGPNAVRRWIPTASMPTTQWIETIPFKETRNYVKKVLFAATVYNQTWGARDLRLSDRMAPIPPRSD